MSNTNNTYLLIKNGQPACVRELTDEIELQVSANEEVTLNVLVFSGNHTVNVVLNGSGACCHLRCVYLAGDEAQPHLRFDVYHKAGETTSDQVVKGIATDRASAFFEGVIRIPQNSQKCDASQNHRAVVLSDKARVTAVPELEIYADDVKCAHGSAIGSLDEKQVFYMMSRGISEEESKKILLRALIKDVLPDLFDQAIIEWMDYHV